MNIENFKKDFAEIADKFKVMYGHFNPEKTRPDLDINNGDCGVFALAVGAVLQNKGYSIQYVDNLNHGFIRLYDVDEDLCFDSNNYEGCSTADMNERWSSDEINPLDYNGMCDAFVPYDVKGAYMIKTILDHYSVPLPEYIQNVLKEELEYEITEYVEKYQAFMARSIEELNAA
ncbi:hypothetical protein CPT_Moabite_302 [Serratia phage Moabite]|uniref:Uncharacterized protein n=1 Tax=Serratia phage Moabite TaxID=2587814 RepID=A0A4Y5TPT3_9CAUD|nr:hypothetical protein HWC48_gp114 [Serratia phage Moabite]QDB71332.1 hypothetical protein CPT_Moabite_302 [Serratia phage Moabite]UGO54185.1 hypothetical protein HAYMO_203 [Serratia phage vB_SmaM_Haymo]